MVSEVAIIREIYNSAWEKNWGFVPTSEVEFDWLAKELKPLVDPPLARIAFMDGEPAGFLLAHPRRQPGPGGAQRRAWPTRSACCGR